MEAEPQMKCTIDLNKPVEELVAVIAAVINVQPSKKVEILRGYFRKKSVVLCVYIEGKITAQDFL